MSLGPPSTGSTSDLASDPARTRVAVVSFRSESAEPGLDRTVSEAIRRELSLRGNFRLENDPDRADYVVRGRILPLSARSNSFSSFVVALEYKVTLALEIEVVRTKGDIIRLANTPFTENDIYLASPDIEITRTNRLEAIRHLSDILAVRIADSVEWIAHPSPASAKEPQADARSAAGVESAGRGAR